MVTRRHRTATALSRARRCWPPQSIPLDDPGSTVPPGVRALDCHPLTGDMVLGTSGCDVVEVVRAHKDEPVVLVDGHKGSVAGLAFHPKVAHKFATASDVGDLCIWDAQARQLLARVALGLLCTAVDFSPNGMHAAVGATDGALVVLPTSDLRKTVARAHVSSEEISDVRYSPDGARLAVASHDNFVYLLSVEDNYLVVAKCTGHSSYVTHLDWSADSAILMRCRAGRGGERCGRARPGQQRHPRLLPQRLGGVRDPLL